MNVSFRQLKVFLYTANLGSLSRAAEKLYISQAAASMALKELESHLGGKLFDRLGRRLVLNENGRVIIPMVSELIGRESVLVDSFTNKSSILGDLIIGASSTIGNYVLPGHIVKFISKHRRCRVKLCVGNTEDIIKKVLAFEVDAGIIEGLCYETAINVIPWMDDELTVFSSAGHELTHIENLGIKDLQKSDWILRETGSGTRRIFENQINSLSIKLNVVLELGHTEAIKNAVSNGNAISCLSKCALTDLANLGKIKLIETPCLNLKRKFYLLLHRDKFKTAALEEFLSELGLSGTEEGRFS